MAFSVKGYVLEPPRVGSANSSFTVTPNNYISDPSAYNTAYPSTEVNPRTEYLTIVLVDGDLPDAQFGWSKNEIVQRFDYDGKDQQFKPLPGAPIITVGTLGSSSNTTRLHVAKPVAGAIAPAPFRLSLGTTGSGLTFTVSLVATNGAFGSPSSGTVELSLSTGDLNWHTSDLTTYAGQAVRFQRQSFYSFQDSNGKIGTIDDVLLLNPIPGTGLAGQYQKPLLRIGFSQWLTSTDLANDAALAAYTPVSGEVAWSRTTGLLKFNSSDVSVNTGKSIYYDGVLYARGLMLPQQDIGAIGAYPSGPILSLPPVETDILVQAYKLIATGGATFPNNTTLSDGSANFLSSGVIAGDELHITSGPLSGKKYPIVSVSTTTLTVSSPFTSLTGATYQVIRRSQFPQTTRLSSIDPVNLGLAGEVQVDGSGNVKYSFIDQIVYAGYSAKAIFADLLIERGISLRVYRTPVDPAASDPSLKDVTAIYPVTGATLADPIIGSPQVFLPLLPLDDGTIVVHVEQGTGFYTSDNFPRFDVPNPPTSTDPILGCVFDFDQRLFQYAVRHTQSLIPIPQTSGAVQLPDPLVRPDNLVLELESSPGSGFYNPLTLGQDALFDSIAGLVKFITTKGLSLATGTGALSGAGATFTDATATFTTGPKPVNAGDFLVITDGSAKGVYGISAVTSTVLTLNESGSLVTGAPYEVLRTKEILADRFFKPIPLIDPATKVEKIRPLGTVTNGVRLSIPLAYVSATRFRFGNGASGTFSVLINTIADDAFFTPPGSLFPGEVEISLSTGNLNFAQFDVDSAQTAYWVNQLVEKQDYKLQPQLGFISLTERLLALDELLVTYTPATQTTPIQERATFLVRKEVLDHPTPATVLSFNHLGRTVASNPGARVWRGGRPQKTSGDGVQVLIDSSSSTLTFQQDTQITDALPHGATIQPNERVEVDYYVYEAMGGEGTTTILLPPMSVVTTTIIDGQSSFAIKGDHTSDFSVNRMLRIENEEVYLLAAPSYDAGSNQTTVNLASPQVFRTAYNGPNLFVTLGQTRTSGSLFLPAYFAAEVSPFETVPRGTNRFRVQGDKTGTYVSGSVVMFAGGFPAVLEFYAVSGSNYKANLNTTEVVLTSNTVRQYTTGVNTLSRTIRPILEDGFKVVHTTNGPLLDRPFLVFRKTEGSRGLVLTPVADYTLDDSGQLTLKQSLVQNEELSMFYTGYSLVQAGVRLRASYTAITVPSEDNGLLNQILTMDYNTFSPDSVYYRVETMTNFRDEIAKQYKSDASASAPTGGPRTSNAASLKLFEQGRESVFFQEGHLANEDIIARSTLKFYNDVVNFLEDTLADMDGRVIGDSSGRFIFDGNLTNPLVPPAVFPVFPPGPIVQPPTNLAGATNQIDDQILVSPLPIDFNASPLFPINFLGTYQPAYKPGPLSRFYPTKKSEFGVTIAGKDTGANFQDQIMDLKVTNVISVDLVRRRRPRARVLRKAYAGDIVLYVTNPNAQDTLLRPAFVNGLAVDILAQDGTPLVTNPLPPAAPTIKVFSILSSPDRIVLSLPLTSDIPIGATITSAALEEAYPGPYAPVGHIYQTPFEYFADLANGKIIYPLDLSLFGLTPAPVMPNSQERWDVALSYYPSSTPEKIPALFGGTTNDSGDEGIPLINPTTNCELTQLDIEQYYETTVLASPNVTPPLISTGNLDVTKLIITNVPGNYASPVPEKYDLVRILSGLNGVTSYRRVVSATVNTITVDVPFGVQDTGFSYQVTVSNTISSGAVGTFASSTLTDLTANFVTDGVLPGYTVVAVTGPSAGARRQVAVVTTSVLGVSPAFPGAGVGSYRIDNALNTYNAVQPLVSALDASKAILSQNLAPFPPSTQPFNNETFAIESALNLVFTDLLNPTIQAGIVSGSTLTGVTDFVAAGVSSKDFVYIRTGANKGIYPIKNPPAPTTTTLTIEGSFPVAVAVNYRIVKAFGITQKKSLKDIFAVLAGDGVHLGVDDILANTDAFKTIVNTQATVLVPPSNPDPNIYANGILPSDLTARSTQVTDRLTTINAGTGPVSNIENSLKSSERLYDKRFTWIKARIDLQSGILPKAERAVAARNKALADILEALTKLLAVQN